MSEQKNPETPSPEVIIKRAVGVGRIMGMNLTPQMVQLANDDNGINLVRRITQLCIKSNPTLDDIDEFIKELNEENNAGVPEENEVHSEEVDEKQGGDEPETLEQP